LRSLRRRIGIALAAQAALIVAVLLAGCHPPTPPTPFLPTDAQVVGNCQLTSSTFASWFQSGSVSLNGVVNPANSTLALQPNCGFYQWGENMFLWLTSPAPTAYGGGAHIFDSPAFYDVSPDNGSGRTLIPHQAGVIRAFPLRMAQRGPHNLPVIMDTAHRLLEVKPVTALNAQARVRDINGKVVVVAHARQEQGKLILLDAKGAIIQPAQPSIGKSATTLRSDINPLIVQKFVIDGIIVFIDPTLAVITTEQGQAGDGSVLEAQTTANGSLVYYSTIVNDVYAYFLTASKDCVTNPGGAGAFCATTTNTSQLFPTTPADLSNIMAFAAGHGKPASSFPDQNALAIEVKTSWVLASSLPNASSYITMTATVPSYNQTNPNTWTPTGQQTVQLALVGMHVVGSTLGHPELVWASFEHQFNTPLATYSYNSQSHGVVTVTQPTSGSWLFAANGSTGPFNQPHMAVSGTPVANSIQASSPFTISPSDTLREQPFGMDGSNTGSNTDILSTNNQVQAMLAAGDVRANYYLIGATWTPFGIPPTGTNGVGTNELANSTMETYQQGSNCFGCHQNFGSAPTVNSQLSHVFSDISPLF
jgi:hypothetical protein